jgi:hypothetical protein
LLNASLRGLTVLALLFAAAPGRLRAQEDYGNKGIFPVYEVSGQWVIFDKKPAKPSPLATGGRFLVIGSEGSQIFDVARTSGTYGGACRGNKPLRLRAALLKGPRGAVGRPIIGIRVPAKFTMKGSRAAYKRLANAVNDETYRALLPVLTESNQTDMQGGLFPTKPDDAKALAIWKDPKNIQSAIDFGSPLPIKGLADAFVFVEDSVISASERRCLRLYSVGKLIGRCTDMPRALMAETAALEFVSYDPSGAGTPFLLAYTKSTPLWGDERWGFRIRADGTQLFLKDAMDIGCREGFSKMSEEAPAAPSPAP